jgi:transcriptional regulator with XRE-family HTH domain
MSRIETGQANPTLTMIDALAGSLKVPVAQLFEAEAPTKARAKAAPSAG